MNKQNLKKVASIAGAAGIVAGTILGAVAFPVDKVVVNETVKFVDKPIPYPVIEYVNQTVEVPVEKIVEVENGNMDVVLNEIFDNDGRVQYLTNDLDDDEIDQIVDRIVLVNDFKKLAVDEAKAEIADLVDKEVVNGNELDEDDVEDIRIDDDADEIEVDEIDFDDKDAELLVTGEFEHDDIEYDFEVRVEFKDGKVEDIELVSVVEQ